MRRNLKKLVLTFLFFLVLPHIFSLDVSGDDTSVAETSLGDVSEILSLFNEKLSNEEKDALSKGEPVIRCIHDLEKVALKKTKFYELEKIRQMMEFLDPNYFAEIFCIFPCENNEGLGDRISSFVYDVPSFLKIPYRQDKGADKGKIRYVFSVAEVVNRIDFEKENRTIIDARLRMKPLSRYIARLDLEKKGENMVVSHINTEPLSIFGIQAVKAYKIIAAISVVKIGDNYLIYGAGGARAWKPEKWEARLNEMFESRLTDFIRYYIEKIKNKESIIEN